MTPGGFHLSPLYAVIPAQWSLKHWESLVVTGSSGLQCHQWCELLYTHSEIPPGSWKPSCHQMIVYSGQALGSLEDFSSGFLVSLLCLLDSGDLCAQSLHPRWLVSSLATSQVSSPRASFLCYGSPGPPTPSSYLFRSLSLAFT